MIRVGVKIESTGRGAPKTLCKKRKDAELGLSSNSSKVTKAKGPFALIDKPHTHATRVPFICHSSPGRAISR